MRTSVLGAKTNREGGPSALAAAFVGKTPAYGLHLDENRVPDVHVKVKANLKKFSDWGALGYAIGKKAENKIPYITGIKEADIDELKVLLRIRRNLRRQTALLHERHYTCLREVKSYLKM